MWVHREKVDKQGVWENPKGIFELKRLLAGSVGTCDCHVQPSSKISVVFLLPNLFLVFFYLAQYSKGYCVLACWIGSICTMAVSTPKNFPEN